MPRNGDLLRMREHYGKLSKIKSDFMTESRRSTTAAEHSLSMSAAQCARAFCEGACYLAWVVLRRGFAGRFPGIAHIAALRVVALCASLASLRQKPPLFLMQGFAPAGPSLTETRSAYGANPSCCGEPLRSTGFPRRLIARALFRIGRTCMRVNLCLAGRGLERWICFSIVVFGCLFHACRFVEGAHAACGKRERRDGQPTTDEAKRRCGLAKRRDGG